MEKKEQNSEKVKSLYWNIIIPAAIVTIIGCLVIAFALNKGTDKVMTNLDTESLQSKVLLIDEVIDREGQTLKDNVLYFQKQTDFENMHRSEYQSMVDDLVDDFNLYSAMISNYQGDVLEFAGDNSSISTSAEIASLNAATSGRVSVFKVVKNDELLLVCSAPLGDEHVIMCQKDVTNVEFMEEYAELLDVVMTVFIDDLRVETTIKDANGNYLKGTTLNNDVIYKQVYSQKVAYNGINNIQGQKYTTLYQPYSVDDSDNVMIFIGISAANIAHTTKSVTTLILPIAILVLIVIIVLTILSISLFIMKPLKETVVAFGSLNGDSGVADLTLRIDVKKNNEIGVMGKEVNKFVDTQQTLLKDVESATTSLQEVGESLASSSQESASAISEIMANIQSVKNAVVKQGEALTEVQQVMQKNIESIENLDGLIEHQSAGIVESSASIEEMVGNISSVTSNVNKMADEFKILMAITNEGRERENAVAAQVANMAQQSQHLADANNVISQIASQTNLLAMNAAIEAAHAGEAGKGFSVVADEIRKLAEDSAKQTKAIKAELDGISKIIGEVVNTSELSVQGFTQITDKVSSTEQLVQQIDGAMSEQQEASQQVLIALRDMTESSQSVQTTSKEMSAGVENVTIAINNLDMIAQTVTGSMEEMSAGVTQINGAAQNVSDMATKTNENIHTVQDILNKFKLD